MRSQLFHKCIFLLTALCCSAVLEASDFVNIYGPKPCSKLFHHRVSEGGTVGFDWQVLSPSPLDVLGGWLSKRPSKKKITPETWVTVYHHSNRSSARINRQPFKELWVDARLKEDDVATIRVESGLAREVISVSPKGPLDVTRPRGSNVFSITIQFKYLTLDRPRRNRSYIDYYFTIEPEHLSHAIILRGTSTPGSKLPAHDDVPWASLPGWYIEKAQRHYQEQFGVELALDPQTGLLLPKP